MSDSVELSSPYGSGSFGYGNRPRTGHSIRSLHRKSASAQYNPILTAQDEHNSGEFQPRNDQPKAPVVTQLGNGRVGKSGTDLVLEILLCAFALSVSAPFMWLAVTMAKYDGREVTREDSDYIKQATSTVYTTVLGTSSDY